MSEIKEEEVLKMSEQGSGGNLTSTNAYYLLYRRISEENINKVEEESIPQYLQNSIVEENKKWEEKKEKFNEKMSKVTPNFYFNDQVYQFTFDKTISLEKMNQLVYQHLNLSLLNISPLDFRVRGFNKNTKTPTEIYEQSQLSESLEKLVFFNGKSLYIQTREKGESWEIENTIKLSLVLSNPSKQKFEEAFEIKISKKANLRDLRQQIVSQIKNLSQIFFSEEDENLKNQPIPLEKIRIIKIHQNTFELIDDSFIDDPLQENILQKYFSIIDNTLLYVEYGESSFLDQNNVLVPFLLTPLSSFVVKQFDIQINTIEIKINHPDSPSTFDIEILIDKRYLFYLIPLLISLIFYLFYLFYFYFLKLFFIFFIFLFILGVYFQF